MTPYTTAQSTRGVPDSAAFVDAVRVRAAVHLLRHSLKEDKLTTFSELGLNEALLKSLEDEGYTTPTPIQAQAIPGVLAGRDLLGIAQTGTGKTAAFALPILHRLAASNRPAPRLGVRALILSPTRELAVQIADSFKTYGRHLDLSVALMYGGVAHRPQINAVRRGVDVLVATPGRLIQHMEERNIVLSGTEILVLDEADQMLDMGFIRPIRQILSKLSDKRQSLFFSATFPTEIGALAAEMLDDPLRVAVTPVAKTADRVKQSVIHVNGQTKQSILVELFADPAMQRTLVFTRTKRGADKLARYLDDAGIKVAAIHGNKSQGQREAALGAFRQGRIRGLVATDIAARGIDIDEITHVINFDLPNIPESYVHRIGRTARAGAEGVAISLCAHDERSLLRDIERLTRQSIQRVDARGVEMPELPPANDREPRQRRDGPPARPRNGRGGERADQAPRGDRGESRFRKEASNRPHNGRGGERSDQAPRGDRGESRFRGDGANRPHNGRGGERSDQAPRGDRGENRFRGDGTNRPHNGRGGERSDQAPRGDRGESRFHGDGANRPHNGRGGERSDQAPRGDRGGNRFRGEASNRPRNIRGVEATGLPPSGDREPGQHRGGSSERPRHARDGQRQGGRNGRNGFKNRRQNSVEAAR